MSLLDEAMEPFAMMDKTTIPDGYGGFITTYAEGATFNAAITYDTSIEARIAAVQGVTSVYQIVTSKAVELDYHDVVKRKADDKVFRVTSDSKDKKTPASAGLNMRVVTAESFVIPG